MRVWSNDHHYYLPTSEVQENQRQLPGYLFTRSAPDTELERMQSKANKQTVTGNNQSHTNSATLIMRMIIASPAQIITQQLEAFRMFKEDASPFPRRNCCCCYCLHEYINETIDSDGRSGDAIASDWVRYHRGGQFVSIN